MRTLLSGHHRDLCREFASLPARNCASGSVAAFDYVIAAEGDGKFMTGMHGRMLEKSKGNTFCRSTGREIELSGRHSRLLAGLNRLWILGYP